MKSRKGESDLVWLGRRMDVAFIFLTKEVPELKHQFINLANEYFIPIITGEYSQEEEDWFFEKMDEVLDTLEENFPNLLN